ncbi:MAG TPA: [protein-PII] uridylyltransferase [Acidobacteriota bacterium]|jgi:[protein-PII] uridylyltransferase|nr:[protein-PII] uridylyltransferase [Acidobacteriota bacterium]
MTKQSGIRNPRLSNNSQSEIRNPKSKDPQSEIRNPKAQGPQSTIRNPQLNDPQLETPGPSLEQDLDAARKELADNIRSKRAGSEALSQYSGRIDHLIRRLYAGAEGQLQSPGAVLALGGYGRRQLCPYSDVDLLVLFEGKIARAEEKFLKLFLHPLWDLRLDLGHHVRELEEFQHLEKDNPEFVLAVLDARFVAGETHLYERFYRLFHSPNSQWYRQILDLLLHLVDQRHARFNNTFYQLEPDVKEAPGALRDLVAGRWIHFLTDEINRTAANQYPGSAYIDQERLAQAENFLLQIRAMLHLESRRNQNVLSHDLQERIAELLGYPGSGAQHRVETFMSDYFRHARTVSRFLESARRAVRVRRKDVKPVPLGQNLEHFRCEIHFRDLEKAASQPTSWLAAFRAAIEEGCPVSDEALSLIRQNLVQYRAESFFPTETETEMLLDFLRPRSGLYGRLSEMHDCGLLGQMFPEFQPIFCRVIRDFYHKYTVDEHTLLTIRNLERLCEPVNPSRERFSSILKELQSPELLVLALLLHDVGKWKAENHAEESVHMAQNVFHRLRLPAESAGKIEFLIKNHLQLSLVAFRRDTEDPDVVRRFAALVGTEENLKTLCLLTLVDIEAVSPDTLTPWKEELIWQLYVDTYNQLTLGYGDEVIEGDLPSLAEVLADRPDDLTQPEISSFLEGFPRRYLKLVDKETIYRHVRLSRNIHPDEIHLSLEKKAAMWELSVVTLDKPFLLANIFGVLAYFGMDILRGQAMTSLSGLVLDIFQFTDHEKFFKLNPGGIAQFKQMLQDVVAGNTELASLLRGKESSVLYRKVRKHVPTLITFDNQHSPRYTILEIVTQDALGLLYRISRVISRHGCDIHLVLISTEGNKAIDVFHITAKEGKLAESLQADLKADLERRLEGGHEINQEYRPS